MILWLPKQLHHHCTQQLWRTVKSWPQKLGTRKLLLINYNRLNLMNKVVYFTSLLMWQSLKNNKYFWFWGSQLWPLTSLTYEGTPIVSVTQIWYKIRWTKSDTQKYWSSYKFFFFFFFLIVRGNSEVQSFYQTHIETNISVYHAKESIQFFHYFVLRIQLGLGFLFFLCCPWVWICLEKMPCDLRRPFLL